MEPVCGVELEGFDCNIVGTVKTMNDFRLMAQRWFFIFSMGRGKNGTQQFYADPEVVPIETFPRTGCESEMRAHRHREQQGAAT